MLSSSTGLLLALALLLCQGLVRSEGSSDGNVEDEVVNENVVPTDKDEEIELIGASPDAHVSFVFTHPESTKDMPSGKIIKFLIGFHNRGEKDFIVRYCETSFRYPQDFSYHIQNFTLAHYERVVAPKHEATFDYALLPSEQFAGRPLGLVVELHYIDSEGSMFKSTLFNETVSIVEDESNFNTETGFLYIIFAVAVVLILLAGQHFLSKVLPFTMDNLEALIKSTVDIGASRASTYALPHDIPNQEKDEQSTLQGLTEDEIYRLMNEVYGEGLDDWCAKGEEVQALRSCQRRMALLAEHFQCCSQKMNELRSDYEEVTERTCSLHHACDQMMAHQTQIAAGAEQIRANLYHFTQYDSIIKKLTSGNVAITGQAFTQLLATIDECLVFLRAHLHYNEAAVYIAKYEQCLSKAMTAIRSGVIGQLQASASAVTQRHMQLGNAQTYNDEDTSALLYGVFAAKAGTVRAAMAVAESRFSAVPEYEAMEIDCHHAYFTIRQQLLTPLLNNSVQQLIKRHADSSCALTRNGCALLLRLCDDEFRLYKQFFTVTGEDKSASRSSSESSSLRTVLAPLLTSSFSFDDFIESLCRMFYDVLRPIVVHNPHLETLTELSNILKVEMIEERCGLMMTVLNPTERTVETTPLDGTTTTVNPRSGFVRVMRELVLDIAERIFYRAVLYAESDICKYEPSAGDVAYPDKLEMINDIATQLSNKQDSSSNDTHAAGTNAVDLNCLWYPTVRRTVLCLSKLYNCLYPSVFECLSRELVTACCDSLQTAAERIETRVASKSSRAQGLMHAQLFVLKHLLILREQTSPFRSAITSGGWEEPAPQRDYSFDLGKYKTSASNLFSTREHWFDLNSKNAFLEFLFQVPVSVSEQLGDFRRIIDARLKLHCHTLVEHAADSVILQLAAFLNTAQQLTKEQMQEQKDDYGATAMHTYVTQAYRQLTSSWPEILTAFHLYIGANDTEDILLQPVKKRIVDVFSRASVLADNLYNDEEKQIASIPLPEQMWVVLNAA